jgi:hypothetical protein
VVDVPDVGSPWHLARVLLSAVCGTLPISALRRSLAITYQAWLRKKARQAIRAGKLPRDEPDRMWGGDGVGELCAVCDLPISRRSLEYELQFDQHSDPPVLHPYHLHLPCFAAWELERVT